MGLKMKQKYLASLTVNLMIKVIPKLLILLDNSASRYWEGNPYIFTLMLELNQLMNLCRKSIGNLYFYIKYIHHHLGIHSQFSILPTTVATCTWSGVISENINSDFTTTDCSLKVFDAQIQNDLFSLENKFANHKIMLNQTSSEQAIFIFYSFRREPVDN